MREETTSRADGERDSAYRLQNASPEYHSNHEQDRACCEQSEKMVRTKQSMSEAVFERQVAGVCLKLQRNESNTQENYASHNMKHSRPAIIRSSVV